tara:strand:- start:7 stop:408 length:402 start_codon:yes stop_codon:yes gene_type:complete
MAATQTTLKLTQTKGVVAVTETGTTPGSQTIVLATTLKKSTETQSSPVVNLQAITWSLAEGGKATITRNSVVLWTLQDRAGKIDFTAFSDIRENASDIVVTFTGSFAGTVVLEVNKLSGYGSQQHQGADGDLG